MWLAKATILSSAATLGGSVLGATSATLLGIPHFASILAGIAAVSTSLTAVIVLVVRPLAAWGHRQDQALLRIEHRQGRMERSLAEVRGKIGLPVQDDPPDPADSL